MTDAVATEVEEEDDEKVTSIEQFEARIARGVGDTVTPTGMTLAWFGPDGKPSYWTRFQPAPLDRFSGVIAVYQNDLVVRVYTLPLEPPKPKPADWDVRFPRRYTLTKTAPTYVVEEMNLTMMA